jgi:hypothetical protein
VWSSYRQCHSIRPLYLLPCNRCCSSFTALLHCDTEAAAASCKHLCSLCRIPYSYN